MIQSVHEKDSSSIVQAGLLSRLGKTRKILFYGLAALLTAFLLLGFWDIVPGVAILWLPDSVLTSLHPDFARFVVPHRVHQAAMHAILWGLLLGVALQLYHPERRVAPLFQALSFMLAFAVIEAVIIGQYIVMNTAPFLVPLLLIDLLHPRACDLFRLGRPDRTMLGLTALAAIPCLVFAHSQAELQRLNVPMDAHAQMEHWQRMAVFAILMIVWGLIGSTNLPGWRLTAWIVAYGSIVYGLQSLIFTHQSSAASTGWAIAAVGWGATYLVSTERRARTDQPERIRLPYGPHCDPAQL